MGDGPGPAWKPAELRADDRPVRVGGRLAHRRWHIGARGHGPLGWSAARNADHSAPYHVFLVLVRVVAEPVDGVCGAGSTMYAFVPG
jgi:hypothetical protein